MRWGEPPAGAKEQILIFSNPRNPLAVLANAGSVFSLLLWASAKNRASSFSENFFETFSIGSGENMVKTQL